MSAAPGIFSRSALGRAMWSFRREVVWVGIFSFFANLLMLTPTLYMLQVFDRVMISGSDLTLLALTVIAVFFFCVMGFAEWIRSRLLVRASAKLDAALSTRVFNASFEARLNSGGLAKAPFQAMADLTNVRQFLTGNGAFAFFDLPWTAIYIAVLFVMHPLLGWTAIAFAIVQGSAALVGHRLTAPLHTRALEAANETNAFLFAKARNAETVEAMGMLGNLRRLWLQSHHRQMSSHEIAFERAHQLQAVTKFLQYAQQSLTLALGAWLAIKGHIGVGSMIASNALIGNALRPISTLASTLKQFVEAKVAYLRLEKAIEDNPERGDGHAPDAVTGQVTLKGLIATAPGRAQPILRGLVAEFKPGEVIAIVGPSGAGKSTLARCLVGVWPGVTQQVLIDGHPIENWSREVLGPHIGYLPQDIELMDGTIAENIARFGAVDSTKVIEAATRTGLHEMILRSPKGYDTPMGEAGGLLSGGQRQRIGLARAIYGEPELVVLDEPNSSLDDVGEAALVKTVHDLKRKGTSVLMIVHQPHLLSVADKALILDQGQIARFGPIVVQNKAQQIEAKA